jgi:hypothetical protein
MMKDVARVEDGSVWQERQQEVLHCESCCGDMQRLALTCSNAP